MIKTLRMKSLCTLVTVFFVAGIIMSCSGGGGHSNFSDSPTTRAVSKVKIDNTPPKTASQTDAPIAIIKDFNGIKDMPAGYNIMYWGMKDASGKPLSITQSYVYKITDPGRGVRTFFNSNGLPVLIRDEVSKSTVQVTWGKGKTTFTIRDSKGTVLANNDLIPNGSTFDVQPVKSLKAAYGSTVCQDSPAKKQAVDPLVQSQYQAIGAGFVVTGGVLAAAGGVAALVFGTAVLPAATFLAATSAALGFVTYALFSDAVLNAPANIRQAISNLETFAQAVVAPVINQLAEWDVGAISTEPDVALEAQDAAETPNQSSMIDMTKVCFSNPLIFNSQGTIVSKLRGNLTPDGYYWNWLNCDSGTCSFGIFDGSIDASGNLSLTVNSSESDGNGQSNTFNGKLTGIISCKPSANSYSKYECTYSNTDENYNEVLVRIDSTSGISDTMTRIISGTWRLQECYSGMCNDSNIIYTYTSSTK